MLQNKLEIAFKEHKVDIPYFILEGDKPGPTIFFSGGIHGDEINGIMIMKQFLDWAEKDNLEARLSGKIYVIPLVNPSAFAHQQRNVFEDNRDLNRSFGVENPTTFSEFMAQELMKNIFTKCDFGIDFHSSGMDGALLPHTRIHTSEQEHYQTTTREIAQLFGTEIVLERLGEKGMLAVEMRTRYQKSVLTVEIGGDSKLYNGYMDEALLGMHNILIGKHMIEGNVTIPLKQYIVDDRFGVSIIEPAIVEFEKNLGDYVKPGDRVGKLYFPLKNKTQDIITPIGGIIFSRWQYNQAPAGTKIYNIVELNDDPNNKTCLLLPEINVEKILM